jgi:hypothetical protein
MEMLVPIYSFGSYYTRFNSRKTKERETRSAGKAEATRTIRDPLSTCKLAFNTTLASDFLCEVVSLTCQSVCPLDVYLTF